MAGCSLAPSCWFYRELMPELPATSRYIKNHFCLRHYGECVRYQLHQQMQSSRHSPHDPDVDAATAPPPAQFH